MENGQEQALAKTMLVFMVKGLFSSLRFPYALFPCNKLSGDLPFWEAVYRLERMGFKVSSISLNTWLVNFVSFHVRNVANI